MNEFLQVSAGTGTAVSERWRQPVVDLQPFALPSVFWHPGYLDDPDLAEHVPFVFWLVEAIRPGLVVAIGAECGTSYFACCQAIQRLAMDARCLHLGSVGEQGEDAADSQARQRFRDYNKLNFSAFSSVGSGRADSRSVRLEDGSVDLLSICAPVEQGDLPDLLAGLQSKLSERSVVLVHGIDRHKKGGAIADSYAEACRGLPHFEFMHGGGLGLIGTGKELPPLLTRLFEADDDQEIKLAVRQMFWRLGQACAASLALGESETIIRNLKKKQRELEKRMHASDQALGVSKAECARLSNTLETIVSSRSWRLTEPLRSVVRRLRSLLDRRRM
ncbi:hypothetical protein [Luteimonas salinilitoris]|uniref:Class I SAM-dependent methyltransferase n=1 Tax=Luteimonas salinilitoris TaxID=3237697 RepID=A0ABV4HTR2_9GAMM